MEKTSSIAPSVLVTGANKGIGLAIARQLGERGYSVWLGGRDVGRSEAAADLREARLNAHALALDVTDPAIVQAATDRLGEQIGALDVLVSNAGISIGMPFRASEERIDDIRSMFEFNTFAPLAVTQAFQPLLRRADDARIVMTSSGLSPLSDATGVAGCSGTSAPPAIARRRPRSTCLR